MEVLDNHKKTFQKFARTFQDANKLLDGKPAAKTLPQAEVDKYVRGICRKLRAPSKGKVGLTFSPECLRALLKEAEQK